MTASRDDARIGRLLRFALLGSFAALLAVSAVEIASALGTDPARPDIVDFHVFAIVGRLVGEGRLPEAYRASIMVGLERALGGRAVFMPYGYPPAFGVLLAPLARLPVAASFLLFSGGTLALFLVVLRGLAGPWFWTASLVAAPAVMIDLRLGQNGLLTAGLAGLSAGFALDRRSGRAGCLAGVLAALKPHLAVGLPVLFLMRRDLRAVAASAVVAVTLSASALLWLGPATLAAFRGGLADTGRFMAEGLFPLHRMVSVFACLLSLGVPAPAAFLLHGLVGCAALAAATVVAVGLADRRAAAGLPLMATAFLSPYFYDYDLPVLVTGLALAMPALASALPGRRFDLLLAALGLGEIGGFLETPFIAEGMAFAPSLGAPVLLACFGVALGALWRASRPAAVPAGVPAP